MVFEKNLKKDFCEVCKGVHTEEHKSHGSEQRIIRLTMTGKVLTTTVLIVLFALIFSYAIRVIGFS